VRSCYRKKDGKRHAYWALVESYRTPRGPRQRVVAWLGAMDEQGRLGVKRCAERTTVQQRGLFFDPQPEWVEVDVKSVRVERSRKFGGPWLGLELLRRLELDRFLEETLPAGREEIAWPLMATVLVLGRLCDASSELHLAERFYASSALAELLSVPAEKVNEDRLYRALDALLPHKTALEKHLQEKLGELFELDYDLLLSDVTSTYFEGQAEKNPQAQRGYSRDHRPDCKQVNIALVVSRCGMPLGYEIFAGNRHDATTLKDIVGHIEGLYGRANRIWVMDRRMAGADNVEFCARGAGATSWGWRRARCANSSWSCWTKTGNWCMRGWRCASRRLRAGRKFSFCAGARSGRPRSRPCTSVSSSASRKASPRSRPVVRRRSRNRWRSPRGWAGCWGATHARPRCSM